MSRLFTQDHVVCVDTNKQTHDLILKKQMQFILLRPYAPSEQVPVVTTIQYAYTSNLLPLRCSERTLSAIKAAFLRLRVTACRKRDYAPRWAQMQIRLITLT
jgi:hypothetical protein